MEEKQVSLLALGIIVAVSMAGLFFFFDAEKTGASYISHEEYGAYHPLPGKDAFPYYSPTYQQAVETPGYQIRAPQEQFWAWHKAPQHTYGAEKGSCAILATKQIAKVPMGYIMDANWQQATYQYGMDKCVREEDSESGWCCKLIEEY